MTMKYILGNWKMNGTRAQAAELARAVAGHKAPAEVRVALFPPALLLPAVAEALAGSAVAFGAQDVSPEKDGAFTGDISAAMLKDAGCGYVIIGHSERRALHGETDAAVQAKARAALSADLIPIICVGESPGEREAGDYLEVVRSQVETSVPEAPEGAFIIAYEPVWAIGTGKIPTPAQISEVHKTIESALASARSGTRARAPIVYGGSVKGANAREIMGTQGVDGVLVGGASLQVHEFCAIIDAGV